MKINNVGCIVISETENGSINVDINKCEIDMQGGPEMSVGQITKALLLHVISKLENDNDYQLPIDKHTNKVTYI